MTSLRPALLAAACILSVSLAGCGDSKSGSAQKTSGQFKEAAGGLIGDKSLKREGQKDQVVGGVKETAADVKDAVKDATN